MPATATFRGSSADLRALARRLPRVLAGLEPDVAGLARGLQLRLGVALLSKVQQAFIQKSRGGTGDDGITWKPLSRATVAGRRIAAAERKAAGVRGKRTRGLLTPAQDARWRRLFARRRALLVAKFGLSLQEASARAAAYAWSVLKGEGAQTRLSLFGGRKVEIGRDTGALFRSLSPGVEDRPSGAPGQEFRAEPGQVAVGTNVPYAGRFHRSRPLWPARLPPAWWRDLLATYRRGLARGLALLITQGVVR